MKNLYNFSGVPKESVDIAARYCPGTFVIQLPIYMEKILKIS